MHLVHEHLTSIPKESLEVKKRVNLKHNTEDDLNVEKDRMTAYVLVAKRPNVYIPDNWIHCQLFLGPFWKTSMDLAF
jgi:hypothetical protein